MARRGRPARAFGRLAAGGVGAVLLPGLSPADVAAAKALAPTGPPREQVGLKTAFQPHTLIGMALFAIWPFTGLVHVFTAPVHYLFRPYIGYRTRPGGRAARPDRRGWERIR